MSGYDCAVVGSGIVGLAHALIAHRRGKRVVVVDRDARPVGASIRNFGFVTVTGQRRGATWARARRTAEIWSEIAAPAGLDIVQRGLLVIARRTEAVGVLEAFAATEMGHSCTLLSAAEVRDLVPSTGGAEVAAALSSPHELRMNSREAIPRLVAHLQSLGVDFAFQTAVHAVETSRLDTARGPIRADEVIVCPGDDLVTLFPEAIARHGVTRCKLQMLRLASPGFELASPVMTDLSLVRYKGYADLPESVPLLKRLEREQPEHLEHGVHLIVAQNRDGTLVVGDSHHYHATPDPFSSEEIDALIEEELEETLGIRAPRRLDRWTGTYSSAKDDMFMDAPAAGVRLVMVTSGTGASTAFAIAEETIADLYGS